MQKSLNKNDSAERNNNIIITGLPEEKINTEEGEIEEDRDKIKWILKFTRNQQLSDDSVNALKILRLGNPKTGYNRAVKIKLPNKEDRYAFSKDTNNLKNSPEPRCKVFVKKDQHPVYIAENNRLRKKANNLKYAPGNANKVVKIINGKQLVDEVIVDENTFFH